MDVSPDSGLREYLAERDVLCPFCGYNLRGLQDAVCPECGRFLRITLTDTPRRKEDPPWLAAASHPLGILAACTLGFGLARGPGAAASVLLFWAGIMVMVRYWRWTRPMLAASNLSPGAKERRGVLITIGGLLLAFAACLLFIAVAGIH